MSGYDRSRIVGESEEHLKEFICGICVGVFIKPTVTQCCGQTYCFDCINEWIHKHNTCPNDREVLSTDQLKPSPKMVTNLLNNMTIKCDFHEKGCKAVVKIIDLEKHKENVCAFNPFRYCDNCGEIKLNHSDKDCIKRLVTKLGDLQKENDNLREQKDMAHINYEKLKVDFERSAGPQPTTNLLPFSKRKQILTKVAKDDKPREQMSAYDYFVQSCREEHKKKHPNEYVVFAEFSKKCAQQWKTMNGKEKNRFILLAEKAEPKPPLSAFLWFCSQRIRDTMNDPSVGEVPKELERRWNECTEEQKSKYIALANTDKARYENEMKAYTAKKGKPATVPKMEESDDGEEDKEENNVAEDQILNRTPLNS